MRRERLPRSWRLNRATDLAAVRRSGRRWHTAHFVLDWRPNPQGHPRLGLVIPRYGATVVQRNRLRRRLREIARRRLMACRTPVDVVVRSRATAYHAEFHELATDFEEWQRSHTG